VKTSEANLYLVAFWCVMMQSLHRHVEQWERVELQLHENYEGLQFLHPRSIS